MRQISICVIILLSGPAFAQDAVEAAASCVVTHEKEGEPDAKTTTCFENVALERTSFESGVCQWKSDAQAEANVRTTTRFVPFCPTNYTAFCDRLVLKAQMIAPVKIFIYDQSADVLERAKMQCLGGGGNWSTNDSMAEEDEALPYSVEDGLVDESTYLGWRVFHSTCHGCHGVDATGSSVAPNLSERVKRLSARDFSIKVLSRYRITMSAEALGDDQSGLRDAFLEQVLRRESGDVLMPAWEQDVNVKPHVLDIYAYLRARADGVLGPGRPERQSERN